ncbi:DUF4232 domain-containing protein [Streptomyces sp. NPDC048441]|uniref:DUF4232 domain-containing protein n=1 Tax=Streptomyces sp. NPDC048441 TaxID=3365552 RepID=UPI00371BBA05
MNHRRKAAATVIGLVAALSLTACNGDDNASADTSADTSTTAPTDSGDADQGSDDSKGDSTTGGGSGSGDTSGGDEATQKPDDATGGGTNAPDEKVGICRTDELEVNAADNTTGKTEGVVTVEFKNGGGRACAINGYAGVDLTSSMGDNVSVARNGEKAIPGILKEGGSAAFNITFPVNNTGGSGVRITKLVVTPPNETKHVTLDWPAGTLPVSDGESGGKLEISPVTRVSDSPAG